MDETSSTTTPDFGFITSPEFRASLIRDYDEMRNCLNAKAWKSVQVISGSIIEALLIDYLTARRPNSLAKDPLKLDLAEAISLCKTEGVLTDRSADLCSVIRSYRNLIHPGRQIRLQEPAPSEQSATIASALVDLIIGEVDRVRMAAFGLTAEQLLNKLMTDSSALAILSHLLADVHESQRRRLLLDLIPKAYLTSYDTTPEGFWSAVRVRQRLEEGFRMILDGSSNTLKAEVAGMFVHMLRNEDGETVRKYCLAFFRAGDLEYVREADRPIIIDYLLSMADQHTPESAKQVAGIEPFLNKNYIGKWLDPYVRALVSPMAQPETKKGVTRALLNAQGNLPEGLGAIMDKRLDEWESRFSVLEKINEASEIKNFKSELSIWREIF